MDTKTLLIIAGAFAAGFVVAKVLEDCPCASANDAVSGFLGAVMGAPRSPAMYPSGSDDVPTSGIKV